jgi:hypothetical protein
VEPLTARFDRLWGQVLAASWWASQHRGVSPAAAEIGDAILACADGDIVRMQGTRTAADLRAMAEYLAAAVRKQKDANDMAVLIRFAGIAKVQAGILGIAEQTGTDVKALLATAIEHFKPPPPERSGG